MFKTTHLNENTLPPSELFDEIVLMSGGLCATDDKD